MASIFVVAFEDSHCLISQFHRSSYKAHDRLIPFFTTKTFLTFAVCIELVAVFHGLEVDLLCEQCNSSFFCTGGNRFECPAHSLAHSWPADNVTSCTRNNGFLATPARDSCGVGTPPFYYEAVIAKLCTGGLRQTVRAQSDSGYAYVCQPGYYGPPGLGACTKCQPGFYTEDFNTSKCTTCALFSYADEGADNRSDCMCNPGYTQARTAGRVRRARRAPSRRHAAVLPARSVTWIRLRHMQQPSARHVETTRPPWQAVLRKKHACATRASTRRTRVARSARRAAPRTGSATLRARRAQPGTIWLSSTLFTALSVLKAHCRPPPTEARSASASPDFSTWTAPQCGPCASCERQTRIST